MSTVAFDTYTAAKHLRDAGFDERQAEAAVSMVRDAVSADRGEVATKADVDSILATLALRFEATLSQLDGLRAALDEHRAATKAALDELRAATKADIAEVRAATKADIAEVRAATKADIAEVRADIAEHRTATKDDIDALRRETKADILREIGTLRSELRWFLGFLAALILAMAAKLFEIV